MIHIPEDSYLHAWLDQFDNTEIYPTWRIAVGLGMVGAVLGRFVYFPFGEAGKIWPNTSVILVGESGDGKDTIIKPAEHLLEKVGVPFIAGKTIEAVKLSLYRVGDPAIGYIGAKELAEFLGAKDYQGGIMEALTDLLSTGEKVDITVKSDLANGDAKWIYNPTLTMFAGSTPDWLQNNLPSGALGGGFLPRFLVVSESDKKKSGIELIPNPGKYKSFEQKAMIEASKASFAAQLASTQKYYQQHGVTAFNEEEEAEHYFNNWYINRHAYFRPTLKAYANRSGGLVRKVAMLMAVTRGHNYIEKPDYIFAIEFILYIAQNLERAVLAVSREITVSFDVLELIQQGPLPHSHIMRVLSPKFGSSWVKKAIVYLTESDQAKLTGGKVVKI